MMKNDNIQMAKEQLNRFGILFGEKATLFTSSEWLVNVSKHSKFSGFVSAFAVI